MPLNEHAISFEVNQQRLWGMLHLPQAATQAVPAVMMLHGFTGQRSEPHRLFVIFARLLASHGIASLRFDCRGSGESEGDFDQMTPTREVEDAVAAYHFLRQRPEVDSSRIGLLGLSMGGMVSALTVAEAGVGFQALGLWAPAHPQNWLGPIPQGTPATAVWAAYQNRGEEAAGTGVAYDKTSDRMDFSGNPVSFDFFEDLLRLEPFETVQRHQGPTLVVHGSADPTVPLAIGEHYAKVSHAQWHVVPGGLHTFETLGTQREAHAVTLEFFKKHLLG